MYLSLFQMSTGTFYSSTPATGWVAPAASEDSDVELDINKEDMKEDDLLDPDYLLALSDDEIPVASSRSPG